MLGYLHNTIKSGSVFEVDRFFWKKYSKILCNLILNIKIIK